MLKIFVIFFGLKGSWKWAVRQMRKGKIVRPYDATGDVKYRFSRDGQNRLQWTFDIEGYKWENAYLFLSDLKSDRWVVFDPEKGF